MPISLPILKIKTSRQPAQNSSPTTNPLPTFKIKLPRSSSRSPQKPKTPNPLKNLPKKLLLPFLIFSLILLLALFGFLQNLTRPHPNNPNQGDPNVDKTAQNYATAHPIINHLPIIHAVYSKDYETYSEFRIDGGHFKDCPTDFCLKITDITGNNRPLALEHIKSLGYNPADFHILYQHTPITPLD